MLLERIAHSDLAILEKLESMRLKDDQYWSFKGRSKRQHCHAIIQYPAMMVPEMQGELIDIIIDQNKSIKSIFDPFVGSGTTLGEALLRGLDFCGRDINPLAILACEVKSGPFYNAALQRSADALMSRILDDNNDNVDIDFFGLNKWFLPRVQIELCKIRRAIRKENKKWVRRFFWIALSNTVRDTCNSRSSTYKLHIKDLDNIDAVGNPIDIFEKKLRKNIALRAEQKKLISEKGMLYRSNHTSNVDLKIADINSEFRQRTRKYDLLVTSPPYGDNSTTVTYGQFSYLPLMWIDTKDLQSNVSDSLLLNSSSIDSAGLGGSLKGACDRASVLIELSDSFAHTYVEISKESEEGLKRLSAFVSDLNNSLPNILKHLNNGAYMLWTLGNRHINGVEVPLNKILKELLEAKNCKYVYEIEREIPSKKMALRNKNVKTMTNETVLVMRKCSDVL